MFDQRLDEISKLVTVSPSPTPSEYSPWCDGHDYKAENKELEIHQEIIDFAKYLSSTPTERHIRLLAINRYRTAVSLIWPDSKMICHGSTATSTNLPDSDLDFVVYNAPTNSSTLTLLEALNQHLIYHKIIFKSAVINARCPIIKGYDRIYNFNVDIAINNENGILNIKRHKMYFQEYPGILPVLMFMKYFLKERKLDMPYNGGISSNTLIQMIVFVVQSMATADRCNCGKILFRFLLYFGNSFNYIATGISTRSDGRLFSKIENLRVSWKTPFCLCIEDPQIPGNFLGENAFESTTFRTACQNAYNRLTKKVTFYEQSILKRVVRYSDLELMIKYRNELKSRFDRLKAVECVDSIPLAPAFGFLKNNFINMDNDNNNNNNYNNNYYNNNKGGYRFRPNYNNNNRNIDRKHTPFVR